MNIRELILDSKELLQRIDAEQNISMDFLRENLGIEENKIRELLEKENIVIDRNPEANISSDLIKQILFKEPETSPSPQNLRELFLSSDKFLQRINSTKSDIRAIILCRYFEMGMRNLQKLFMKEGFEIGLNPNAKIPFSLLKEIIAPKPEADTELGKTLKELEAKIKDTEEREYVKSVVLNQFVRSESIREYAKIRANGICELCESLAPFNDKYGKPFLETHHVIYLSKGGKDTIENVVALCPNCHRKIHNLSLESDVDKLLKKRIKDSSQDTNYYN